jgi:hypothetical protein
MPNKKTPTKTATKKSSVKKSVKKLPTQRNYRRKIRQINCPQKAHKFHSLKSTPLQKTMFLLRQLTAEILPKLAPSNSYENGVCRK